jgi:hypothetical protein
MDSWTGAAYTAIPGDDCGDHASLYDRPAPARQRQDEDAWALGICYPPICRRCGRRLGSPKTCSPPCSNGLGAP